MTGAVTLNLFDNYSFLKNCCWVKESLEYRELRDWLGNLQLTQTPSVQTTVSPVAQSMPGHYLPVYTAVPWTQTDWNQVEINSGAPGSACAAV